MRVTIESAIELSDSQTAALNKKVVEAFGKKVEIFHKIDPNLIGGLRIITPHKTVDLSLAARLAQLNHSLQTTN